MRSNIRIFIHRTELKKNIPHIRKDIVMKFTKLLSLVLATVFCVSLISCGTSPKTVDDIKSSGKLVIATSPDFPPFEYLEGNEVVGIEIDILKLLANELGVELVIEQMTFDSVLPGVQAGKYDLGVSGITVDADREKNTAFTDPYFLASQAIVVMEGSEITCKADLTGKKIAVQTGTTAEKYCQDNGYEVLSYESNNDSCSALTAGKVDAWVVDNEVAIAMSAETNGQTKVLDEAMTSEPYAFAMLKGSDELASALSEYINKWVADGTIAGIFEKYGTIYVSPAK